MHLGKDNNLFLLKVLEKFTYEVQTTKCKVVLLRSYLLRFSAKRFCLRSAKWFYII